MKKLLTLVFLILGTMTVEAQSRFQLLHEMPLDTIINSKFTVQEYLIDGDKMYWIIGNYQNDDNEKIGVTDLNTKHTTILKEGRGNYKELKKVGNSIVFIWTLSSPGTISLAHLFRTDGTIQGTQAITSSIYSFSELIVSGSYCYYSYPEANAMCWDEARDELTNLNTTVNNFYVSKVIDSRLYVISDNSLHVFDGTIKRTCTLPTSRADRFNGFDVQIHNSSKVTLSFFDYGSRPNYTYIKKLYEYELTGNTIRMVDSTSYGNTDLTPSMYFNNKLTYTKRNILYSDNGLTAPTRLFNETIVNSHFNPMTQTLIVSVQGQIWGYNGNTTELLLDSISNNTSGYRLASSYSHNVGPKSIFRALNKATLETEVWATDGSLQGTYLLGTAPNITNNQINFDILFKNNLLFIAFNIENSYIILQSNLQPNSLVQLCQREISPSSWGSLADIIPVSPSKQLIWGNFDAKLGIELYIIENGRATLLKDIRRGALSVNPRDGFVYNGNYYFIGDDGVHGTEWWVTDGTSQGTRLLEDFSIGGRPTEWDFITAIDSSKKILFTPGFNDLPVRLYLMDNDLPMPSLTNYTPQTFEWHRTVSQKLSNGNEIQNEGLSQDYEGNIYAMIFGNEQEYLEDSLNNRMSRVFPNSTLIKYRPNGELAWKKNFGGGKNIVFALNKNGGFSVAFTILNYSQFNDYGALDTMLLRANTGNAVLAEYSSTGDLLWSKQWNIGTEGEIYGLSYESDGNLIIAGQFTGFAARFDDFNLAANKSPQYFIAKYKPFNKFVWANDFELANSTSIGEIKKIEVTPDGFVYVATSSGGYNWWSSCKYRNWQLSLSKIATNNGDVVWTKDMTSDDMTFITGMAVGKDGIVHIQGLYRGVFTISPGRVLSSSCDEEYPFQVQFAPNGKVIHSKEDRVLKRKPFGLYFDKQGLKYEIFIEKTENSDQKPGYYSYYYPSNRTTVNINIYDGNENIKSISLNRGGFDEKWDGNPLITIDSAGVITFSDESWGLDTFPNFNSAHSLVHIVKFKPLPTSAPSAPDVQLAASDITLYPNPTTGYLVLQSDDRDFADMQYEVFDLLGRPIAALRGESYGVGYQSLDVTPFAQGTYFLRCTLGGKTLTTLKFVKL